MGFEVPFRILAFPGSARIVSDGPVAASIHAATGTEQADANGPHVLLTCDALTLSGCYVETADSVISTQISPEMTFRIATGADITSVSLHVGIFRGRPTDNTASLFDRAELRYDTTADVTAFWRAVSADGATVETTVTTAAIAVDTEYLIRIACTSTTVLFYVNGTLVATHSTNVPTPTTLLRAGVYLLALSDAARSFAFGHLAAGALDHGQLAGLSDDDHSQYFLLLGRTGGQTAVGGTASGNALVLQSTSDATKGGIRLGTGDWLNLPEVSAPGTPSANRVVLYAKSDGLVYAKDDGGTETKLSNDVGGGSGDVVGPGSATDNAVARFDGTTGKLIQNSAVIVDDSGNVSGVAALTTTGAIELGHASDTTITRVSAGVISVEGSNVLLASGLGSITQAYDAELAAIAGLTSAADKGIQFTGAGTAATFDLTAAGKALLDDASAAAQATTLGLGTGDSPQFAAVNLSHASANTLTGSGGDAFIEGSLLYRAGGTDVPVTDGGTGASTAADARTNLGITGRLLRAPQVLTSGTSYTTPAGCNQILVDLLGGGGGGGGCSSNTANSAGGAGGGSGGGAAKFYAVTPSTSYTYAIGGAGAGGANTGGTGGTGGDTTFTDGVTLVTAKGGLGGAGMTAGAGLTFSAAGAGGPVSTNGDRNGAGHPGSHGTRYTGLVAASGAGGGAGGGVGRVAAGAGTDAAGFGAGGGGALVINHSGAVIGGAGSAGVIIIWEFD